MARPTVKADTIRLLPTCQDWQMPITTDWTKFEKRKHVDEDGVSVRASALFIMVPKRPKARY